MLFSSHLVLKRLSEDRLELRLASRMKYVLLIIAGFLLYAIISTTPAGMSGLISRANLVPLLLTAAALLGAAYHECWVFDRKGGRLLYQFGLVFAHSNRIIALETLEQVKLECFVKGRLSAKQENERSLWQRRVFTLSLTDREGKLYRLESYQNTNPDEIRQTAQAIADYCGLPLVGWEKEAPA
jgi:hypothetical protein